MNVPTVLRGLHARVFGESWRSVVAGVAVMVVSLGLSAVTGPAVLLIAAAAIGGLVAGFAFGKDRKPTARIGFRVGFIGAIVALCVGLSLMAGGLWTMEHGPDNLGVTEPPVEEPDAEEPAVVETTADRSDAEESDVSELSTGTSMFYLIGFTILFIPASVLLAMIGSAVGTTVRRAVVPDRYNPPLF